MIIFRGHVEISFPLPSLWNHKKINCRYYESMPFEGVYVYSCQTTGRPAVFTILQKKPVECPLKVKWTTKCAGKNVLISALLLEIVIQSFSTRNGTLENSVTTAISLVSTFLSRTVLRNSNVKLHVVWLGGWFWKASDMAINGHQPHFFPDNGQASLNNKMVVP